LFAGGLKDMATDSRRRGLVRADPLALPVVDPETIGTVQALSLRPARHTRLNRISYRATGGGDCLRNNSQNQRRIYDTVEGEKNNAGLRTRSHD
jgi:hypothetical protein